MENHPRGVGAFLPLVVELFAFQTIGASFVFLGYLCS